MKSTLNYIKGHKFFSFLLIIIVIGGFFYIKGKLENNSTVVTYKTETVMREMLVQTVSGTGQIETVNQIDLKTKASGDITYIGAVEGATISAGVLFLALDDSDAKKTVRDAEVNLESALISLEQIKEPASELSLLQAQNDVEQAIENKQNKESDLEKTYEDLFNTISDAFLDLPSIMTDMEGVLYDTDFTSGTGNIWYYRDLVDSYDENIIVYQDDLIKAYEQTRASYEDVHIDYMSLSRYSSREEIESLLVHTYDVTKEVADLVKKANNYIDLVKDILVQRNIAVPSFVDTHLTQLGSYTGTTNSHLSALLSEKNTLSSIKEDILNADRDILEKQKKLEELEAGAGDLDIRTKELSVRQRQNALQDAKEDLAEYYVYAPFTGVVAGLSVQRGEHVSNGTSVATLITDQKTACITLNEIDAAKVRMGQKATLTFDAVEGIIISGSVIGIDTIGQSQSGVITYDVVIKLDSEDVQIKPGMSVNTVIITAVRQDVFVVPNSAVKISGDQSYVEVITEEGEDTLTKPEIKQKYVELGISNDLETEVLSGLEIGDVVITSQSQGSYEAVEITEGSAAFNLTGGRGMRR